MKGFITLFVLLQGSYGSIAQTNFEKDSTFTKSLSEFLTDELEGFDESSKEVRLVKSNLKFLEIKDLGTARYFRLSQSPLIRNCAIVIQLTYPPFSEKELTYTDDICIKWWIQSSVKQYKVEIKNYYDDVLMSLVTPSNEVTLKKEVLDKFIEQESRILFTVKDNSSKEKAEYFPLERAVVINNQFTYLCMPEKPIMALVCGLYNELDSGSIDEAKTYYELAAKLSDNPHYQTLLKNFNMRNKIVRESN